MALRDLIQLLAQVLVHLVVVNAVDEVDALLQGQNVQVILPHPPLHIGVADGAHGVRFDEGAFDGLPRLRVGLRFRVRSRQGGCFFLRSLLLGLSSGLFTLAPAGSRLLVFRRFSRKRCHSTQGQHQRQGQQHRDTLLSHLAPPLYRFPAAHRQASAFDDLQPDLQLAPEFTYPLRLRQAVHNGTGQRYQ